MYRSRGRGGVRNNRRISAIDDNNAGMLSAVLTGRTPPRSVQGVADIVEIALSRGFLTAGPEIRK